MNRTQDWGARLASRYFSPSELARLNPGSYHDHRHAIFVAETTAWLARNLERPGERILFLAQVGLIHDADSRPLNTPARTQVTLEWMESNPGLDERFEWDDLALAEAMALIARTDHPFDGRGRRLGTRFDGKSPIAVYEELLDRLPHKRRKAVMEDAQVLRFADQVANYCRDYRTASQALDGLVLELRHSGMNADRATLDTAGFLDSLCQDLDPDRALATERGLAPRFFTAAELRSKLPPEFQKNLYRNRNQFAWERVRTIAA